MSMSMNTHIKWGPVRIDMFRCYLNIEHSTLNIQR